MESSIAHGCLTGTPGTPGLRKGFSTMKSPGVVALAALAGLVSSTGGAGPAEELSQNRLGKQVTGARGDASTSRKRHRRQIKAAMIRARILLHDRVDTVPIIEDGHVPVAAGGQAIYTLDDIDHPYDAYSNGQVRISPSTEVSVHQSMFTGTDIAMIPVNFPAFKIRDTLPKSQTGLISTSELPKAPSKLLSTVAALASTTTIGYINSPKAWCNPLTTAISMNNTWSAIRSEVSTIPSRASLITLGAIQSRNKDQEGSIRPRQAVRELKQRLRCLKSRRKVNTSVVMGSDNATENQSSNIASTSPNVRTAVPVDAEIAVPKTSVSNTQLFALIAILGFVIARFLTVGGPETGSKQASADGFLEDVSPSSSVSVMPLSKAAHLTQPARAGRAAPSLAVMRRCSSDFSLPM